MLNIYKFNWRRLREAKSEPIYKKWVRLGGDAGMGTSCSHDTSYYCLPTFLFIFYWKRCGILKKIINTGANLQNLQICN